VIGAVAEIVAEQVALLKGGFWLLALARSAVRLTSKVPLLSVILP
jgi:hypothetical protein